MTTTLVVDGYNAIYAIPVLREAMAKSLKSARTALLAKAKKYAKSSGFITDVKVVFDGDDKYRDDGALALAGDASQVFSKSGEGDDAVIQTVKKCSRYGRVIVASNDNYVRNNSRVHGAKPIPVQELMTPRAGNKTSKRKSIKKIDICVQEKITREYKKELGL